MPDLEDAVLVWTGWKRCSFPSRRDTDVVAAFGRRRGEVLLQAVHELTRVFNESDAWLREADLAHAELQAQREFKTKLPEMSDSTTRALAWCYSFDRK